MWRAQHARIAPARHCKRLRAKYRTRAPPCRAAEAFNTHRQSLRIIGRIRCREAEDVRQAARRVRAHVPIAVLHDGALRDILHQTAEIGDPNLLIAALKVLRERLQMGWRTM